MNRTEVPLIFPNCDGKNFEVESNKITLIDLLLISFFFIIDTMSRWWFLLKSIVSDNSCTQKPGRWLDRNIGIRVFDHTLIICLRANDISEPLRNSFIHQTPSRYVRHSWKLSRFQSVLRCSMINRRRETNRSIALSNTVKRIESENK